MKERTHKDAVLVILKLIVKSDTDLGLRRIVTDNCHYSQRNNKRSMMAVDRSPDPYGNEMVGNTSIWCIPLVVLFIHLPLDRIDKVRIHIQIIPLY